MPLVAVFAEASRKGFAAYLAALHEPMAVAALKLTVLAAAIAVPLNLVFGVAAAWAISKFHFRGKSALVSFIAPSVRGLARDLRDDLQPPVGRPGILGPVVKALDVKVVFAVPGIVLATVFVTFPFVARELIPLMQADWTEEEASRVLGASGWQMFRRVTVPNIKWGLLYIVILCNARAMGEFGAVSVVSGRVRDRFPPHPPRPRDARGEAPGRVAAAALAPHAVDQWEEA